MTITTAAISNSVFVYRIIIWINVRHGDWLIVEDVMQWHVPNYTKIDFNSLKMIQNDSFSADKTESLKYHRVIIACL